MLGEDDTKNLTSKVLNDLLQVWNKHGNAINKLIQIFKIFQPLVIKYFQTWRKELAIIHFWIKRICHFLETGFLTDFLNFWKTYMFRVVVHVPFSADKIIGKLNKNFMCNFSSEIPLLCYYPSLCTRCHYYLPLRLFCHNIIRIFKDCSFPKIILFT